MRPRGILLHRSVAAVIVVCSLLATATTASASGVQSEKQKVAQLADQLDNLENRLGQLGEDYGAAQDKKAALDQDIADSQARIAQQRLASVSSPGTRRHCRRQVRHRQRPRVDPLFSNAAAYTEADKDPSAGWPSTGLRKHRRDVGPCGDLAKEQRRWAQAAAGRRSRGEWIPSSASRTADRIRTETCLGPGRSRRCNRAGASVAPKLPRPLRSPGRNRLRMRRRPVRRLQPCGPTRWGYGAAPQGTHLQRCRPANWRGRHGWRRHRGGGNQAPPVVGGGNRDPVLARPCDWHRRRPTGSTPLPVDAQARPLARIPAGTGISRTRMAMERHTSATEPPQSPGPRRRTPRSSSPDCGTYSSNGGGRRSGAA